MQLPITEYTNSYPILHRLLDIAQYWSNYCFWQGASL